MSSFSTVVRTEFTHAGTFDLVKNYLQGLVAWDAESLCLGFKQFDIDFGSLFDYGDFTFEITDDFIYILNNRDAIGWINRKGYVLLQLPKPAIEMANEGNVIFLKYRKSGGIYRRRLYVTDDLNYSFMNGGS